MKVKVNKFNSTEDYIIFLQNKVFYISYRSEKWSKGFDAANKIANNLQEELTQVKAENEDLKTKLGIIID